MRLESELSKPQILELYLNSVYFGDGAYGVGAASERYFGVAPAHLDLAREPVGGSHPGPVRIRPAAATIAGASATGAGPHVDGARWLRHGKPRVGCAS